jgi:large subunit ribosomal protein L18
MEKNVLKKNKIRKKRLLRVRQKLRGSQQRPRMCVTRSNRHVYVQLIDDEQAITLASSSTISKDFRQTEANRKHLAAAKKIGLKIAELAKSQNIERVRFDRGWQKYHGVIAAIADGAREGGLEF